MTNRMSRRGAVRVGAWAALGAGVLVAAGLPRTAEESAPVLEPTVVEAPVVAMGGFGGGWDLPNLDHPRVDYWVGRFDTVPAMREKFEGFLERAGRWAPPILERLEARGMPRDLIFLAMIESGFNPDARSHAKAAGVWQFIPETGKRYGLAIDRAVDERHDPIRATDAALDYLQDLHDRFNSWYLAAAAYNTGENRVGRIMRETFGRERAESEADYYRIWDALPAETRDYVPLMIAAARISKDRARYGFAGVEPLSPIDWEEVVVPPATLLSSIADERGLTVHEIKQINPHFRIHRTPNDRSYAVRVPTGPGAGAAMNATETAD